MDVIRAFGHTIGKMKICIEKRAEYKSLRFTTLMICFQVSSNGFGNIKRSNGGKGEDAMSKRHNNQSSKCRDSRIEFMGEKSFWMWGK